MHQKFDPPKEHKRLPEWRCTRNACYDNPKAKSFTDPSCRQGYYITAETKDQAMIIMARRFPDDPHTQGFTVDRWD